MTKSKAVTSRGRRRRRRGRTPACGECGYWVSFSRMKTHKRTCWVAKLFKRIDHLEQTLNRFLKKR